MRPERALVFASTAALVSCGAVLGLESEYRERPSDASLDGGPPGSDSATSDAESCTEVTSDPENCGACGTKCPRAARCTSGKCVDAEELTPAGADPTGVAVDDGSVYWVDRGKSALQGGAIYACPKAGTCTPRRLATMTEPLAIALVGGHVIVTAKKLDGSGDLRVWSLTKADSDQTPLECAPNQAIVSLHALASVGDRVYAAFDKDIQQCLETCSPAARCTKVTDAPKAVALAATATRVAWIDTSGLVQCVPNGGVCNAETVLIPDGGLAPSAKTVALDDTAIFFASGTGSVTKLEAAPAAELAIVRGLPSFMAIDGASLLLATSRGISRVPSAGSTATHLAGGVDAVGLASDATHIYFSERNGRVLRIPR